METLKKERQRPKFLVQLLFLREPDFKPVRKIRIESSEEVDTENDMEDISSEEKSDEKSSDPDF